MAKIMTLCLLAVANCLICVGFSYAESLDDLATRMSTNLNISKAAAEKQIEMVFDEIAKELKSGKEVEVKNFGKFYVQNRNAYTRKNPNSGATIQIPAKRYLRFTPDDELKKAINPPVDK